MRTIVLGVMWWIVSGAVVLGVGVLAAAVAALLGRLRPLERALRRLGRRAEQAQGLQTSLEALQTRVEEITERSGQLRLSRHEEHARVDVTRVDVTPR